ncbi:MAG: hypothetical protein ACK56I_32255, partial [bacterium]
RCSIDQPRNLASTRWNKLTARKTVLRPRPTSYRTRSFSDGRAGSKRGWLRLADARRRGVR